MTETQQTRAIIKELCLRIIEKNNGVNDYSMAEIRRSFTRQGFPEANIPRKATLSNWWADYRATKNASKEEVPEFKAPNSKRSPRHDIDPAERLETIIHSYMDLLETGRVDGETVDAARIVSTLTGSLKQFTNIPPDLARLIPELILACERHSLNPAVMIRGIILRLNESSKIEISSGEQIKEDMGEIQVDRVKRELSEEGIDYE